MHVGHRNSERGLVGTTGHPPTHGVATCLEATFLGTLKFRTGRIFKRATEDTESQVAGSGTPKSFRDLVSVHTGHGTQKEDAGRQVC